MSNPTCSTGPGWKTWSNSRWSRWPANTVLAAREITCACSMAGFAKDSPSPRWPGPWTFPSRQSTIISGTRAIGSPASSRKKPERSSNGIVPQKTPPRSLHKSGNNSATIFLGTVGWKTPCDGTRLGSAPRQPHAGEYPAGTKHRPGDAGRLWALPSDWQLGQQRRRHQRFAGRHRRDGNGRVGRPRGPGKDRPSNPRAYRSFSCGCAGGRAAVVKQRRRTLFRLPRNRAPRRRSIGRHGAGKSLPHRGRGTGRSDRTKSRRAHRQRF